MNSTPEELSRRWPGVEHPSNESHRAGATIDVVIPTLNEERTIARALESVRSQCRPIGQIVVVDGASSDCTVAIAREHGASVLVSPKRGRGFQIAYAVRQCTADIVLVMHADMILPPESTGSISERMATDPGCPGGCLGHRFDRRSVGLWCVERWDCLRARIRGVSFGDQAQFFRRKLLESVGGFPDQPIMEDIELSSRLRRLGKPAYLNVPVRVSARRFESLGFWRTILINVRCRRIYRQKGLAECQAVYEQYVQGHARLTQAATDRG